MHDKDRLISCRPFRVAKRGNSEAEYEDAYASAPERGRFAIADGASESWYADLWARLLVEEYVVNPVAGPDEWDSWLPPLQKQWLAEIINRPIPWYGQDKIQDGAFATFLGVDLGITGGECQGRWRAVAVGDSCVFVIRDERLNSAFPINQAEDFNNRPWLLGSRRPASDILDRQKERRIEGDWRRGDRIWLMTDALAQWFLREVETGRRPWEAVGMLLDDAPAKHDFASWVENLRDTENLRNDDVTLVAVSL